MFSKACEYLRCLRSLEWQVVSNFYCHLHETHTKSVPPCPAENRAHCTIPGGHQQILAKSWHSQVHPILSYLFRVHPKSAPDKECVIILKDHSINGTKEEIQNKSKEPNIKAKEPKLKAKSQSQSKMDNPLKPPYKGLNRT